MKSYSNCKCPPHLECWCEVCNQIRDNIWITILTTCKGRKPKTPPDSFLSLKLLKKINASFCCKTDNKRFTKVTVTNLGKLLFFLSIKIVTKIKTSHNYQLSFSLLEKIVTCCQWRFQSNPETYISLFLTFPRFSCTFSSNWNCTNTGCWSDPR